MNKLIKKNILVNLSKNRLSQEIQLETHCYMNGIFY